MSLPSSSAFVRGVGQGIKRGRSRRCAGPCDPGDAELHAGRGRGGCKWESVMDRIGDVVFPAVHSTGVVRGEQEWESA